MERRRKLLSDTLKKPLCIAVSCVLAVGALLAAPAVNASTAPVTIASWAFPDSPATPRTDNPSTASIPSDNGAGKDGALLSVNTGKTSWASTKYFFGSAGWDGNAGDKYWQIVLPKGSDYTNITVTAQFKVSSSMTSFHFKAQYITAANMTYQDVNNSTFAVTTTMADVQFGGQSNTLSLPDGTTGIRFTPADTIDTSKSGGTFYINNVTVQGVASSSSATVAAVTATPSVAPVNGFVPKGTSVSLACATAGAPIYYQLNATGDDYETGKQTYNVNAPIVIDETATIRAWAELDGTKGAVTSFTYSVDTGTGGDTGGNESGVTTIADARAENGDGKGTPITVEGVASVPYLSSASALGVYIQDATGGIMLYGNSVLSTLGIKVGDTVKATGATQNYTSGGKYELVVTSAEIVSTPGSAPAAKSATVDALGEPAGGMLVHFDNAAVSGFATDSYKNVTFTLTQNGKTLNAKYDSRRDDTDKTNVAALTAALTNAAQADVTGVLEGYNGAYTLLLRDKDDVSDAQTDGTGGGTQQAGVVSAAPGSGATVAVGDTVTLASATEGAAIKYKTGDAAGYSDYTGPVTVTALPFTVTAYSVKDGMTDGTPVTFTYPAAYTGTYNIYFGQLHSHTTLSDGVGKVEDAFDHASNVSNLDFLAVTDHSNYFESATDAAAHKNTITDGSASASWQEGQNAADAITAEKKTTGNKSDSGATFLGIYGYEMTWSDGSGHINTFNTPGFEDRQNPTYKNNSQSATNPSGLKAYYDTLTQVPGSNSQFNHPGTTFGDFYDFTNYSPAYDGLIDMIEVGNGEGPIRGAGYFPSYEYYTRALDKGWHVAPTNNQDNHKGNWGDSNTARSVILAPDLSEQSLYDAMKARRVYATEDNDLSIYYTLDGSVMGSELSLAKTDTVHIEAKLSDPTDTAIGKVDVIVNGGRVAATKTLDSKTGDVTFDLPNTYSYYYLRVTEPDKDIAVTAPVWTGAVDKAGIASTVSDTTLPIKGETMNVTSSLYNNEQTPLTVESLTYTLADGTVLNTAAGKDLKNGATIAPLGTAQYSFAYTPQKAGDQTINVTLKASQNGVEKTYTGTLSLSVADQNAVTRVLIDGTHMNDYVTGYYAHNMNNFTQIAADDGTQVRVETNAITPDMLKNTQLLVISAPAKKTGTATDGTPYSPQTFSDDFISMVKDYVQSGGHVVVCGTADYQDGSSPYTTIEQDNKLLAGIGATARVDSNEMMDDQKNGGQSYRLYLQNFNTSSPLFAGVDSKQQYSAYSGCTVNPGSGTWLVKGYDTTYANVSHGANAGQASVQKGSVIALSEESVGAGQVITSGTIFLSDFEVKATLDNYGDLQYANYNIAKNLLNAVKVAIPATSIADVRKNGQPGDVYAVEGTVTAGSETPNAFTDTIYIQDATGGINIYPVPNGSGVKVGQKVRVVAHVDAYQGDKELKIGSGVETYEVTDTAVNPLKPKGLSAKEASDYTANGGLLANVTGVVSDIKKDASGVLQSFVLKDGTNDAGIRIFINGYINPDTNLDSVVQPNAVVSAAGLVYTDPDGVCLRVRDRGEIYKLRDPVAGGAPTVVAQPGQNLPALQIGGNADAVRQAIVNALTTPALQAAAADGTLQIVLNEQPAVPGTQDKQKLTDALASLQNTHLSALFLNLSLVATAGSVSEPVTQLKDGGSLTLTLHVPDELKNHGYKFFVVRLHNGETTVLNDTDSDPDTVTFVTDRFSTYALAYQSTADDTNDTQTPDQQTATPDDTAGDAQTNDAKEKNPNTGVEAPFAGSTTVTFAAPLCAGPLGRSRKRR